MKHKDIKTGMRVTDRWWSYLLGKVVKTSRTSVWVRWDAGSENESRQGSVERYDSAHIQFLESAR